MEEERQENKEEFIIYLTINNTRFDDVEVLVTNPTDTTRNQIGFMRKVFELPDYDERGHALLYLLGLISDNLVIPEILDFEYKNGEEIPFDKHNIKSGDHFLLFSIPIIPPHPYSNLFPRLESQTYDEDFIVNLTIEGTALEEVEVAVTDPHKTIRNLIDDMVRVFDLPKMDSVGLPVQYLLGQVPDDGDETEILEFDDENGREQSLLDYNIHPGDRLRLITVPCAYGSPIPDELQRETKLDSPFQRVKRYFYKIFHRKA